MKRSILLAAAGGSAFAYEGLPVSVRRQVEGETEVIHRLLAKTAINVVQIGLRLKLVHSAIGRDRFQQWLRAEFCWSQSAASKYMRAAAVFADVDCLDRFHASALYVLARHCCSPAARQEALERARSGELITRSRADSIAAQHRNRDSESSRTQIALAKKTVRRLADQLMQLDEEGLRSVVEQLDSLVDRLRAALPPVHCLSSHLSSHERH